MYEILHTKEKVARFLPETMKLQTSEELGEMLNKYTKIYAKACVGSRGQQVIKITKKTEKLFELCYYKNSLNISTVDSLALLLKQIYSTFHTENVIIQQAIDLIEVNGSIIDLRAEVQRNKKGLLEIVAIPVRVSLGRSPITTHAASYPFETLFHSYLHCSKAAADILQHSIDQCIIEVYLGIEDIYGLVGELGIDLGIDKKGKIWFIEANSQSAKVSLINAYDERTIEKAFLNPLEFAKYLHQQGK